MVMETPSPQCVGREFVRQYYTLLNEAPMHLHRFYSNNSSFVHGGVEKPGEEQPPVTGQADIHKKIMSLNFRDCHAKIRQVDSQSTVDNAVVVQVTGELSNNGEPMRRFMQTFVLAPQSPKKYYVHNDIFRYQDEVFHDNDTDTENQEETVDSEPEICLLADSEPENVEGESQPETVQDPTVSSYFDQPSNPQLSNGNAHLEDRVDSPPPKPLEEPEKVVEEPPQNSFDPVPESKPEPEPEPEPQVAEPPKPFSWAALAGKNTATANTTSNTAPGGPPQASVKAPVSMKPEVKTDGSSGPQPQRAPRPARDRGARERDGSRNAGDTEEGDRRSRYPDTHQIFVGNLPQDIEEKDLKQFFEKYGKVVELRINKKASTTLPAFGFVVFEDAGPVGRVLGEKRILFNGEHRLNVEPKKQRGEGGRPGSGTRTGGRGSSSGAGRGGAGGPGRGGRGGSSGGGPGRVDSRSGTSGGGANRGGFGAPPRR